MYNNCFGGFDISNFAKFEYVKRVWKDKLFKIYRTFPNEELTRLIKFGEEYTDNDIYFLDDKGNRFKFPNWNCDYETRRDPILISLLEEYGSEKISSSCSRIAIEEIDETDYWKIIEFEDGAEEVITLSTNGWHK